MKKKKSNIKESSKERRKKFDKWVSVPMLKQCGNLPTIGANCKPIWIEKTIHCFKCKMVYGAVFKKNGKYYCMSCLDGKTEELEKYENIKRD